MYIIILIVMVFVLDLAVVDAAAVVVSTLI